MRRVYFTLAAALVAVAAFAAAPNGSGTYYSAANGKKGAQLKTALCRILYDTRNNPPLSYSALWDAFYTTDVRDEGENKLWDMYSNHTPYLTLGTNQDTGSGGNVEGQYYNREHSFPQSWFGSNTPMYTDLHHIYPTDKCVNGKRSNYPFGTTNGEEYKSENNFSKLGSCTYPGYTGTVFEPNDEYKGDFARTYFYMVTCYEEQLSSWVSNYSSTDVVNVLDGNTYPGLKAWQLNMFLEWAAADPVSQKEINRNNEVKKLQGNRNPFIDYPGLEQYIWGSKTNDTFSYDNYVQPDGSSSGGGGDDPGDDPTPGTYKLIITPADFNGASYAANNNEKTSYAVCTTDATKTYEVKWTSNQVMLQTGNMQWKKNEGYIYNSTDLGTITEVKVNISSSGGTFTTYYGTSEQPSSSTEVGGGFFKVVTGSSDTGKTDSVEVIFTIGGGSSLEESDLALSSSSLSFNLYNDSGNKTINYTTSSTGTVTVSGGTGFVTTSINTNTKTITVTPVAKTTTPQTITISQAADGTYAAGEVTFTVTVDDTTPVTSYCWVETSISDLTPSDVFVIVGTSSKGTFGLPHDGGDSAAPDAKSVTVTGDQITSTVADKLKWNIGGNATNGYVFYPNESSSTWLYCTNDNNGVRIGGTNTNNTFKIVDGYLQHQGTSRYVGVYNKQDWRCYLSKTGNSNIANQTFRFFKRFACQTISVGDTGYATMVADANLIIPSGVEVFAAQANDTYAHLEPVTNGIPKDEAVVVKASEGSYNFLYASGPVPSLANNDLVAAKTDVTANGSQYCLANKDSGIGFYQVQAGIVIPAGKAYLIVSNGVKAFYGFEDEDPDGVNDLNANVNLNNGAIFNLAGQRLNKLQKGINIVGNKKILK